METTSDILRNGISAQSGGKDMNGKEAKPGNHLVWYKGLESWVANPICFKESFVPEMRDIIQVDVEEYA